VNKNYYAYFDNPESNQKFLLIPSTGGININQMNFECFDATNKIKEELNLIAKFNSLQAVNKTINLLKQNEKN
jgi:hypothetical protein